VVRRELAALGKTMGKTMGKTTGKPAARAAPEGDNTEAGEEQAG